MPKGTIVISETHLQKGLKLPFWAFEGAPRVYKVVQGKFEADITAEFIKVDLKSGRARIQTEELLKQQAFSLNGE